MEKEVDEHVASARADSMNGVSTASKSLVILLLHPERPAMGGLCARTSYGLANSGDQCNDNKKRSYFH
jgi:hypothetical protein